MEEKGIDLEKLKRVEQSICELFIKFTEGKISYQKLMEKGILLLQQNNISLEENHALLNRKMPNFAGGSNV